MSEATTGVAGLRTHGVRFVRYRVCPARARFLELIVHVDGSRFSWCLPEPVVEAEPPVATRIELLAHRSGVILVARDRTGRAQAVDVGQAIAMLTRPAPVPLAIDRRLVPLHA